MDDKKKRSAAFKREESAIRNIINDWGPIGSPVPEDEYDCLVHKVISRLHAGGNEPDVARVLTDELRNHFGLGNVPAGDIEAASKRICQAFRTP